MNIVLALLLAFSAPLFLLFVEAVLPYPFVIEELVKLLAVILLVREEQEKNRSFCIFILLVGALFTISESVFYLVNIFTEGDLSLFPKRLLITGMLHIGTTFLIYLFGRRNKYLLVIGFLLAVLIHYYFNLWVGDFTR